MAEIVCHNCATERSLHNFPLDGLPEATYVATMPDGSEWPLCNEHGMLALIAGWNPKRRLLEKASTLNWD